MQHYRQIGTVFVVLLTLATHVHAQQVSDFPVTVTPLSRALDTERNRALSRALTDYIPHVMRAHGTPGLAIAVGRDGNIVYEAGFGLKGVARRKPMTPDTTFFTGSMAKTYTALAAMQLVEKGVLKLDEPVNRHLKSFQIRNPLGGGEVTLRHLLTHRSGLSSNVGGGIPSDFGKSGTLQQRLVEVYQNTPKFNATFHGSLLPTWGAKVGEKWQYSNTGTATLGYLVEANNPDDLDFEAYLQRYIFAPLGMKSTQHPPLLTPEKTRPDLWARRSIGNERIGTFLVGDSHKVSPEAPAGGMIKTVGDFVRLPMAFIAGGSLDGEFVTSPKTVAAMIAPQFDTAKGYHQGLMWKLDGVAGKKPFRFWHPGGAPNGHTNVYGGWPKLGLATAMHTNSWPITTARYVDMHQIEAFLLRWIDDETALGRPPEFRSWAWKTSYVMGVLSTEAEAFVGVTKNEYVGFLDARVARASYALGHPSLSGYWDEAGFRAGVSDAFAAKGQLTTDRLRTLAAVGGMRVRRGDFKEIYTNLGGSGSQIPAYFGK